MSYHYPTIVALGCEMASTVLGGPGRHQYRLTDLLTRPVETGKTVRDTGDARPAARQVSETCLDAGDVGDARRMARNPEVAGSNPAPAIKARGPFSNREGSSRMWFVNRSVHGAVSAP